MEIPGKPIAPEELRASPRVLFDGPVEVIFPRACTVHSVDLTEGGIGLVLDEVFEVGDRITLKIFEGRALVHGEICWHREDADVHRHAVRFSRDDLKVVKAIQAMREEGNSD